MENNDIRKEINEIDDDDLDVVAGGTDTDGVDKTPVNAKCPFCGQKVTVPKDFVSVWMKNHIVCCPENPCA